MGEWCRWFGLSLWIQGKGMGWLHVRRLGRGCSLWLQPFRPNDEKSPKYLCYVPKTLANYLFSLDLNRARSLAFGLLYERYGHFKVRCEKFILHSKARMRRLGWVNVTGVGAGRLILYRKKKSFVYSLF